MREVKLGPRELAVLHALVESGGRVVDRDRLRQKPGLQDLNDRTCDSALVGIRRVLGPDAVVTVRRRGWRLNPEAVGVAATIISSLG